MTTEYSAHPALASEQLRRAELSTQNASKGSSQHRWHHTPSVPSAPSSKVISSGSPTKLRPTNKTTKSAAQLFSSTTTKCSIDDRTTRKALPERTNFTAHTADDVAVDGDGDGDGDDEDDDVNFADDEEENNTKDCVDCAPACAVPQTNSSTHYADRDEPDHLQYRFDRTHHNNNSSSSTTTRPHFHKDSRNALDDSGVVSGVCGASPIAGDECFSGLSSAISSPSPSTVSSPLSTPTRLAPQLHHSHQHCCQKQKGGAALAALAGATQHHLHHQHAHQHAGGAGGCKKAQKFDPRLGPSRYRQLLPIILCILSFAVVFATLFIYMDTTEIRHQQFRLNMSRDDDLFGVSQDDPTLIAFLREIHMNKYPMHFLKNRDTFPAAPAVQFNFSAGHHDELTPTMAHYVADLLGGKLNGVAIQSLPGALGQYLTAPWLSGTLNWAGIIVEPEPRRYFALRKQNAHRTRMQVVHACVSPNTYPKEITIHNDDTEVRINSLMDEETTWFNSRVKCFPLYTVMLACNRVEYDLLSLGVHGHELEILQTLPFDKVRIEVISIHLLDDYEDVRSYVKSITKFLMGKSYAFQKKFGCNYFYQRINSTSRTRKKDILVLKTP